jgi:hypothetical protein
MSCLVVIRVGDSSGTWYSASRAGKWSSPESHVQAVRNAMVEGYTVYGLFVSTGDIPIAAKRAKKFMKAANCMLQ